MIPGVIGIAIAALGAVWGAFDPSIGLGWGFIYGGVFGAIVGKMVDTMLCHAGWL